MSTGLRIRSIGIRDAKKDHKKEEEEEQEDNMPIAILCDSKSKALREHVNMATRADMTSIACALVADGKEREAEKRAARKRKAAEKGKENTKGESGRAGK